MEDSKISWTNNTFNPWMGCTKVSPACTKCYAENLTTTKGLLDGWGKGSPRKRTSKTTWARPLKWDRQARESGKRLRVFCASLADVFDEEVSSEWRRDLFDLIKKTPNLDWLLLTKRPHLIENQLREIGVWQSLPWRQIWFGTTAENQEWFDKRWDHLRKVPAVVRFISYEPACGSLILPDSARGELDWFIAGGETSPKKNGSRPSNPEWFRSTRDQCENMEISFHFKQWGNDIPNSNGEMEWYGKTSRYFIENHAILDGKTHFNCPEPVLERIS